MPTRTTKNVTAEQDSAVTSASFAVTAGDLIVVCCGSQFADPTLPVLNIGISDTLGTLSWTEVTAEDHGDVSFDTVTSIFYATAGATSPGTVTVTTTGATCDATWLRVDTVSSWTAVTNTKTYAVGYIGAGNLTLTFDGAPDTSSLCIAACTRGPTNYNANENWAMPSGWTALTNATIALATSNGSATNMQYAAVDRTGSAVTTCIFTTTFDTGAAQIIGIEITGPVAVVDRILMEDGFSILQEVGGAGGVIGENGIQFIASKIPYSRSAILRSAVR